jgi:hypothetical protein
MFVTKLIRAFETNTGRFDVYYLSMNFLKFYRKLLETMNYQLNMKNIPPTKRSFHGRKLQYQEKVVEQTCFSSSTTTSASSPTYLTADSAWKTVTPSKPTDGCQRQVHRKST